MGSAPAKTLDRIRFGEDFELDALAGELRRSGRLLKLERIPTDLLLFFVERPGQLISRDEIIARVWGKDVFVDTDSSINAAIRKIRQVLKDDPVEPKFVQTITGRGYRFIAPVMGNEFPAVQEESLSVAQGIENLGGTRSTASRPPIARRWAIAAVGGIALIAVLALCYQRPGSRVLASRNSGRVVLAVLPFENLTGDTSQDYFSDGMTEEMISQLGRTNPSDLGVIGRTSVMLYKNNPKNLTQVGHELGAQYVLEGSVRRDLTKVRITAQLIQIRDQTHLWSREYDRELNGILALEGEIAAEIADEIELTLGQNGKRTETPQQTSLSAQQYDAYDLYLKGQYFWNKRTVDGFRQAIQYFQQAIEKDPTYARAYAGLADCYSLLGGYSLGLQTEFMPKARVAALRALEIDPGLAEAHTALALVVQNYDWDWQTAEKEYQRAIQLDSNYPTAHHWYAEHLALRGRFEEALRESERARQLDPLSLIIAADNGAILYFSRQYDRAIAQFNAVLEMQPGFPRATLAVNAYAQKGSFGEALAQIEKQSRLVGYGPWSWSEEAYVHGRAGQQAQARLALEKLQKFYRQQSTDPVAIVWAYIGMNQKDQALSWLQKGYAQHSSALTTLKVEPGYDPLRSDLRFQDLMRKVGLATP
jgi:TolB-like protein/DNA-binding winged helix-turn-helix (wHTH) protein/Tfp pilus assembly protein PilF